MSRYKYILFDLDGTLSESAPGIRKSLEHAIEALGIPSPDLDDYTLYIGPPLIDTFINVCRLDSERAGQGCELYREYYNSKGKYLNRLYDGVEELLTGLRNKNARIAVCSSKFEKFARETIEILGAEKYFDAVCGSTIDGSRKDKKDLIPYAVGALGGDFEKDRDKTVMIGDTHFDAEGARLCGVDFIGVEYGYGSVEAMKKAGAKLFAKTPADIYRLID